jgi:surface antigen
MLIAKPRLIGLTVCLAMLLLVNGCQTAGKAETGAAIGGVLGGLIGHQIDDGGTMGTLIGTAVGGAAGYYIGKYMDEQDIARRNEALDFNEVGETAFWRNEGRGAEYRVTPQTAAYQSPRGRCRTFEQEVYIDGRRDSVTATACKRDESATWEMVEGDQSETSPFLSG